MTTSAVNIIIVDNNSKEREDLRSHLRIQDYGQIDFAMGGLHLLHLLENNEYHLVILGSNMPDMSAMEMVSLIRTRFDDDSLSIVHIYSKDMDKNLVLEMGLEGVIMCVRSDNYILQIQNRIKDIQNNN